MMLPKLFRASSRRLGGSMAMMLDTESSDDDVEVALVCPTQTLGELERTKADQSDYSVLPSDGAKNKKKVSTWKRVQRKFVSETFQCVISLVLLFVMIGSIVLSYMYCRVCLFGIMVISACLCPFMPYFNIPLWTSILLIVILGMTYTQRPFTFIWN